MKCKFYDASWTGFVICNYYERIMRYVKMTVLHFTITRGNFGERVTSMRSMYRFTVRYTWLHSYTGVMVL